MVGDAYNNIRRRWAIAYVVAILAIVNEIPQLFTGYAHPTQFIGVSLPSWGKGCPALGYHSIERQMRWYQSQQLVGDVVYSTIFNHIHLGEVFNRFTPAVIIPSFICMRKVIQNRSQTLNK